MHCGCVYSHKFSKSQPSHVTFTWCVASHTTCCPKPPVICPPPFIPVHHPWLPRSASTIHVRHNLHPSSPHWLASKVKIIVTSKSSFLFLLLYTHSCPVTTICIQHHLRPIPRHPPVLKATAINPSKYFFLFFPTHLFPHHPPCPRHLRPSPASMASASTSSESSTMASTRIEGSFIHSFFFTLICAHNHPHSPSPHPPMWRLVPPPRDHHHIHKGEHNLPYCLLLTLHLVCLHANGLHANMSSCEWPACPWSARQLSAHQCVNALSREWPPCPQSAQQRSTPPRPHGNGPHSNSLHANMSTHPQPAPLTYIYMFLL